MKITGRVWLGHMRGGRVLSFQYGENLVVNTGRTLLRDSCKDGATPGKKYIAFGSDATAVSEADTALGAELLNIPTGANREGATELYADVYSIGYLNTSVDKDAGVDDTVAEMGLFDTQAHSAGIMLCRFLPQPFEMENGDSVFFYWALTFGD